MDWSVVLYDDFAVVNQSTSRVQTFDRIDIDRQRAHRVVMARLCTDYRSLVNADCRRGPVLGCVRVVVRSFPPKSVH